MSRPISNSVDTPAEKVSAIVISYFTGPILERAVSALRRQQEIGEIILVDNGNFPGAVAAAVEKSAAGAPVRILSGHGNIGFAAACNKGASVAMFPYLLFVNPDAVMPEGGVRRLLEDGAALSRPWLMGAKLIGPDGVEQQGSRREALTPWRAFVEVTRLYRLAPRHPYFQRFNLHTQDAPKTVTQLPTISGACFITPTADYTIIGGMDERYFLHVEDVDFCLRFTKAGGGVYFNPHVEVTHYKSSSRANPIKIEARKTAGVIRFFNTHFRTAYPAPFLLIVSGALWGSFGVLAARRAAVKAVRLARMGVRKGRRGAARAQRIYSDRTSR